MLLPDENKCLLVYCHLRIVTEADATNFYKCSIFETIWCIINVSQIHLSCVHVCKHGLAVVFKYFILNTFCLCGNFYPVYNSS